jgi:REP element-mobilizing transposase RayT
LRRQQVARTVLGALRDSNHGAFRIVHYSVQENHVHLLVEAESAATLASGMRGLAVRLAKRVNRLLLRRGPFWADRWHGQALTSPRQVRHALVYVLHNHRKHLPRGVSRRQLDALSSAASFDGFAEPLPRGLRGIGPPVTAVAGTWLLRVGWQRRGRIHIWEAPGGL